MSFESVFEKWLTSKDAEEGEESEAGAGVLAAANNPASEVAAEESMPEIPTGLWHTGTPLLQQVEELPCVQPGSRKQLSSTPPLHASLAHKDACTNGRLCHHSLDPLLGREKSKTFVTHDAGDSSNLRLHGLPGNEESNESLNCGNCSAQLPLTELATLTQLGLTASPTILKGSEIDPLLSPEMEQPMEPDSTSEVLPGTVKYGELNQKGGSSIREVSPRVIASPCNAGCGRDAVPCNRSMGMTVLGEESQAECDSTSLLLASPSAISPASQGEIEERICPVLTDREDSASPAHCVCQCRALHPHASLIARDLTHATATGNPCTVTSHTSSPHTVTSQHLNAVMDNAASNKSQPKSRSLVQSHCAAAPDQKVASANPLPFVKIQSAGDLLHCESKASPSVFPKVQLTDNLSKTDPCQRNKSLKANKDSHKETNTSCGLLSPGRDKDTVQHLRHHAKSGPSRLTVRSQETTSKVVRKQAEVCDFATNIDWDSAVAETVESPSSMVECGGESKPGIILKIRTKAVVQCRELSPHPRPPKRSVTLKRKDHSVDNSEMLSRLRKRQKPEEQKPEDSKNSELVISQRREDISRHNHKGGVEKSGSCSDRSVPVNSRKRRNTVQLGGDVKTYTHHLSSSHRLFVESATKLSRLQTQTYNLVCTLFPLLRLHVSTMTPESSQFTTVIDDIIRSLEHSDSEETVQHCEDLCDSLEQLTLGRDSVVPVFSPQVMLCSSPQHFLQEFQDKVCTLLQLLLPDITVSFSDSLSDAPDQLEEVLKRVVAVNDKATRKNLCRPSPLCIRK